MPGTTVLLCKFLTAEKRYQSACGIKLMLQLKKTKQVKKSANTWSDWELKNSHIIFHGDA